MTPNTVLGILLPALVASAGLALALELSAGAPPRWRLLLATTGLLVWLIPWPLLNPSLFAPPASIVSTLGGTLVEQLTNTGSQPANAAVSATPTERGSLSVWNWVLWTTALLPGLLLIIRDIVRHRRTLARWQRNSANGEHLRTLLPLALRRMPLVIRIVPHSHVAAATGFFRGTIWIGDALVAHAQLRPALLHECLHIARRDPAFILILRLIRGRIAGIPSFAISSVERNCASSRRAMKAAPGSWADATIATAWRH